MSPTKWKTMNDNIILIRHRFDEVHIGFHPGAGDRIFLEQEHHLNGFQMVFQEWKQDCQFCFLKV